jgi:hypothetical protein
MDAVKIEDVKIGELFTKKEIENPNETQVFTRMEYCRESKKYCAQRFSDFCDYQYLRKGTVVYINFTF